MKRILSALIAFSGLLATGCIKNEVTDVNIRRSDDYIGFSATTTRASVSSLQTMQGDASGFRVYATSGDSPSGWYADDANNSIDGMNIHKYIENTWRFVNPVKWPESTGGYPMKFYAVYPADPAGLNVSGGFSSGTALKAEYTVQATTAAQVDLLAATAKADLQPSSGTLPLTFKHILSRINFGIIAGTGVEVQIQSVSMVNAAQTRTYDLITGEWIVAATGNASYAYYGESSGGSLPTWPGAAAITADESTANPIYTGNEAANKHLVLMPQTSASWSPVSGAAITAASGGYVSVTYRMSTGNGNNGQGNPNEVGFINANNHPDNANGSGGVTGPLFVKAGFPLPKNAEGDFVWEQGKSYVYNLGLGIHGSCNGYILDEYYYNENGSRTNLRLVEVRNEGKKVGDKLQNGKISVTLVTDDWSDSGSNIQKGTIKISPDMLSLPHTVQIPAQRSLNLVCRDGSGAPDNTRSWTLTSSDPSWLKLSLNSDGSGADETVAGTGSASIYLVLTANGTGAIRTAQLYLNGTAANVAGTVSQSANIESITGGGAIPAGFTTYVGAFWKHNQTGERIIRINAGVVPTNYGAWSASVAWMDPQWSAGDGVVLALGGSPGATAGTAGLTSYDADAEHFQITNGSGYVSGMLDASNKDIIFRIGLKSEYRPTVQYPVRYAVVLLTYAGKTQKIFLRQGEYDDYLMTDSDPVTTGNLPSRTRTKKFSPYNLTANLNQAADVSGIYPAVNPGRFTDYPTQAGAFFQWAETRTANNRIRWAWAPIGSSVSYWGNISSQINWNTIAAAHETCPAGYRRPIDGSTTEWTQNTNISGSENRQSLWWKPQVEPNSSNDENSVWGYYADGFFDRRQIVSSPTGTASSAVAADGNDVAYVGRLFFNPLSASDHYNASIFFPAAGRRGTSGVLANTGEDGNYWSSSTPGMRDAWNAVWIRNDGFTGQENANKNEGKSIRCVRQ